MLTCFNVVLLQVLVDDVNAGYQQFQNLQVLRVNGADVVNLKHLKQLIHGCTEQHIWIDLEDDRVIVLNRKVADQATERVRQRYRVPYLMSADIGNDTSNSQGSVGAAVAGGSSNGATEQQLH